MKTKPKGIHVVPNKKGNNWAIKKANAVRATKLCRTQSEAVKEARGISQNQGSELLIHRPNGQIRERDSHGRDPFPPRG